MMLVMFVFLNSLASCVREEGGGGGGGVPNFEKKATGDKYILHYAS